MAYRRQDQEKIDDRARVISGSIPTYRRNAAAFYLAEAEDRYEHGEWQEAQAAAQIAQAFALFESL